MEPFRYSTFASRMAKFDTSPLSSLSPTNNMSPEARKRLTDIVLTALAGALIAFLQGLLTGLAGADLPTANPEVAGAVAGSIKGLTLLGRAH